MLNVKGIILDWLGSQSIFAREDSQSIVESFDIEVASDNSTVGVDEEVDRAINLEECCPFRVGASIIADVVERLGAVCCDSLAERSLVLVERDAYDIDTLAIVELLAGVFVGELEELVAVDARLSVVGSPERNYEHFAADRVSGESLSVDLCSTVDAVELVGIGLDCCLFL